MVSIRPETSDDRLAVGEVLVKAFNRFNEYNLVTSLRQQAFFNPSLALVAELDGKVCGYALCIPISIQNAQGQHACLSLAPLAVMPAFQGQGIGFQLLSEMILRAKGYSCILVMGNPPLFTKAGFAPAAKWGISPPFEAPEGFYQAYPLAEPIPSGTALYPELPLS